MVRDGTTTSQFGVTIGTSSTIIVPSTLSVTTPKIQGTYEQGPQEDLKNIYKMSKKNKLLERGIRVLNITL